MRTLKYRLLALVAVLLLVAAACGGDDDAGDDTGDSGDTTATTAPADTGDDTGDDGGTDEETTTTAADDGGDDGGDAMAMPGEGKTVTMGRADWSTGYFQAYVYEALLEELGYDVTDPAELELGPSLAYLSMAQGDFDFWVNSWMPGHISWFEPELPDGSKVGDHLTVIGPASTAAGEFAPAFTDCEDCGEIIAGGLQGFLITKSFAEEFDITTMDDLNNNPDALAAFDAADPVPGNGIADIYGCQESFTCDNIIQSQIAYGNGEQPWDNITQVIAGYDAMAAEAAAKADEGTPMVIYTWTPSAYITTMRPGDNVLWLGVEAVLDDSNPADVDEGEFHDQRPGTANIGPEQCPSAADMGTCQLGWIAADILVTANSEWLEAEPAARALFDQVQLPVIDVSLANVEQAAGKDSNEDIKQLAADWIAQNRALVDEWLDAARAAA